MLNCMKKLSGTETIGGVLTKLKQMFLAFVVYLENAGHVRGDV